VFRNSFCEIKLRGPGSCVAEPRSHSPPGNGNGTEYQMPNPLRDNAENIASSLSSILSHIAKWRQRAPTEWHRFSVTNSYYQLKELPDSELLRRLEQASAARTRVDVPLSHTIKRNVGQQAPGFATSATKAALNVVHGSMPLIAAGSHTLVSAGGLGVAIAPWVGGASILFQYRGDINANNLYDVVGNPKYRCDCVAATDDSEACDCDGVIRWIIDRTESDLIVTAISIFLFGLPSMATSAYRLATKAKKNFSWEGDGKSVYPTPDRQEAYWHPDTANCETCGREFGWSRFFSLGYDKDNNRHHCRLCGKCCCTKCCFHNATITNPLTSSDSKKQPPRSASSGTSASQSKNKTEACRVCIDCIAAVQAEQQAHRTYSTGPLRMARKLIDNSIPGIRGPRGCTRSLAAIYALARGDTQKMLCALVAYDGDAAIARWAKM
jgi:hypothetical protein